MDNLKILKTSPCCDYELLDSGEGEKLERFGKFILSRPDPQALWRKLLPISEWQKTDAVFAHSGAKGGWKKNPTAPEKWKVEFGGLNFFIKPTAFKHTGLFPEQEPNWQWIIKNIKSANRQVSILNLFGYTGGATLAALSAGAEVAHIDGSKSVIVWAKENAVLSGLSNKPVRWILDDARDFVKREIRRGKRYEGIIMDPPAFGHGPKKELWKIEDDFLILMKLCEEILSDDPIFFLINGYSAGYSSIAYGNNLLPFKEKFGGDIEKGELAIEESESGRLLPAGIFARWSLS
ncbi:MAG: class I SAM-dependent methyltransferase [Patescibacteria group bacterium]|nr:class I SAM-dependent methyltransferase [Patescibacteria group bacterium]MDE1988659.1 class I SAM-dependent methyltransferase [Patescibacteria group bacterium]MDE2218580.1 class I SAM-dependent methyltransferase [Patescibacteria group bacterium]